MAESQRKSTTVRSVSVRELVAEAEAETRDETVGCLRYSLLAAIFLLLLGMAGTAGVFVAAQLGLRENAEVKANGGVADGVTVAVKKTDPGKLARDALRQSEQAAEAAGGFAIDLGGAQSFSELSARFARIVAENAELGFDKLEPRATLRDTVDGVEARLLVGPFATGEAAAAACAEIALPADAECTTAPFAGAAIARE